MQSAIVSIVCMICVSLLTSGCAHTPPKHKQESLTFKDPANEQKAKDLQSTLLIDQTNVESHLELGRIFLSEDMLKEAIGEFEKVLSLDSNHIRARLLLSLAYQRLPTPNFSKATGLLENAAELAPENAEVHLNLAQIYGKLKEDTKAISEFKRTIELSDDGATLVSSHLGLMAVYKKQGELEKAQEQYNAAYRIFPGVEEMIRQAEISRITPTPKYGVGDTVEDEWHPKLEKRIEQAQDEITKITGRDNEDR